MRLAAGLLLAALVAAPAAAADDELTLWHVYSGAEREALELAVERYNARHPERPIVPSASSSSQSTTALSTIRNCFSPQSISARTP